MQRRKILQHFALSAAALYSPGLFAEALTITPKQTEGPFYPDKLPLDTDNDLIIVNDKLTPAVGTIAHLTGRVMDRHGKPVRNALVEIWQVDSQGIYLHTGSPNRDKMDGNFQGFGRFLTGRTGEYYFRTIQPVAYGGSSFQRTPHIHVNVKIKGQDTFTTQCYIKGEPLNKRDGVLNRLKDKKAKESLMVEFKSIEDSPAGEVAGRFDMVLGNTPPM